MTAKIKTLIWSFRMALRINKTMLIVWLALSVALSLLPAVALSFNRQIIADISAFISTGQGSFSDVAQPILFLGLIMVVTGLSARYSGEYAANIMQDTYMLGMDEHIINCVNSLQMKDYLRKDILDDCDVVLKGGNALNNVVVYTCSIAARITGLISLLVVAWGMSRFVFTASVCYIVLILFLNLKFLDGRKFIWDKVLKMMRRSGHIESIPNIPGAAKELRIYNTRHKILSDWETAIEPVYSEDRKRAFYTELSTFISGALFYLFMAGMLAYSLFGVANATMTVDAFLIIFTLCLNIFIGISDLTKSVLHVYERLHRLQRQYEFTEKTMGRSWTPEKAGLLSSADQSCDTVFEARGLCFGYNDTNAVLHDVDFSLKKGEIVALVGHNGSGKSTLVKLLLQLFRPDKGELLFFGKPYDQYDHEFVRENINAFFQEFTIFHMSVKENVGIGDLGNINNTERIMDAIDKGGARKVIDKLPSGADTLLQRAADPTGHILSGGENQRVGVSRAHMSDKDVIIFDEPAAMLDPIAEMEQFLNIKQKLQGRSAVLISHRVGFARMADRIVVMDKGRVIETGTHEHLINQNGAYAEFFNQQAKWYDQDSVVDVRDTEMAL